MKKVFLFIALFFLASHSFSQTLPAGFFSSNISSGATWTAPVGATFTPDGQRLFVWEKDGRVYVCNRDASGNYVKQAQPVIDIAAEVGGWRDFGLIGFALDPAFASNGRIFLLYVVDRHHLVTGGLAANGYNAATNLYFSATIGRVTRYTTSTSGGNLTAVASSRRILLGESMSTGIPILHESHGVGGLAFAADGTLLITAGDGASYNVADGGSISHTYYAQALTDGIIRTQENVGAFRSQMLNSHNGKLLRISAETGDGISSNPFYDAGSPRSAKSRVYAFGLRNPFRVSVKPGTGSANPLTGDIGEVFIGDVGWNTWEELNVVKAPGTNFGWPLYEGHTSLASYMNFETQNGDEPNAFGTCSGRTHYRFKDLLRQDNGAGDKRVYNPCNASQLIGNHNRYIHARPSIDWQHGQDVARVGKFNASGVATNPTIGTAESNVVGTPFRGNCSSGGAWFNGTNSNYPAEYKNKFIAADYGGNWIRRLSMDFTDVVTRVDNFATNAGPVVCIAENPFDGTIVTVDIGGNTVKKITYGGNQPPVAKPTSNVVFGSSPLTVNFTGNTSFDPTPGGSIASYSWNFGGGSPATSTATNPSGIVFTEASGNPRRFVVRLTVTDNGGATHTDSIIISVNNTAPVVNITSPVKNSTYLIGDDVVYPCTATVTDAQHSGSQLKYEWQTILRHNNHEHPEGIDINASTSTTISRIGCNGDTYYWLIRLKVTDAAGLSTIDSSKIFPNCGGDLTPPAVSSVVPLNGANAVSTGTSVTANFSEAIDASTVTGTTFQLKNGASVIAASLNTNSAQVVLTPSATLTGSTLYTATIKGGASGVKDLAGNPLASDHTWSFTTAAVDIIAPTVSSVTPANAATGVVVNTTVTAVFNEAMNAGTISSSTIELRNASNALIAGTVSYNAGTRTVTLTPSASLANSTLHTVTIKGGAAGVKDAAGNALAADYNWSFTTAAVVGGGAGETYSIWPTTATPAEATNNDGQGIALGVKIRSSQTGFINGIRYYKGAGTTGTHTGHLWSATGVLLGSVTFSSETASGWQQALFASPVAINANTTYVASIFSPSGHYAANDPYFTTAVTNGPIKALANGEDGPNGLYRYTATNAFPNNNFNSSNYWVDVVFSSGGSLPNVSVTTHPSSQARCAGANASFTSAATGNPAPTVQWQESSNGSTWTNITGATTGTLSFSASLADNNKQYRAVWTNSSGAVNSNAATLTVNAIPSAPVVTVVNNCGSAVLTASGFTGSLLWSNGATTASITVTTAGVHTVTQTINGCVSTAGTGTAAPINSSVAAPTISVVNNCTNSVLTASGVIGTLLWSNGATTNPITVTTAGTYTVSQTVSGCTSPLASAIAAPVNATIAAPAVVVVNNCGNSVLTASGFTGSLLWSNGATTNPVTVTTAGSFSVAQTIGGCTGSSGNGIAAPKAIPVLSGSLTGNATSGFPFNYTAGSSTAGTSFTWSRAVVAGISNAAGAGTGNVSESLINTTAAPLSVTYIFTLTANGCTNNQNVVITVNPASAQPPVSILSVDTKTGTFATTHSLTAVPAGALLVLATTADAVVSNCIVSSTPALTWTKRVDAGAVSSDNAEIWTAAYAAGGSITITSNWGGDNSQSSVCYVALNAEPVLGGASAFAVSQASPSVTITTTRENSIIFGCTADWKAVNGATRTLRDAATERFYFKDGNFTTYHYTKAAPTIGSYTEGISLPTGQQASTALLEIRSVSGVATRAANNLIVVTLPNATIYSNSLGQNFPNPFEKGTTIPFTISGTEKVNMVLYDINGRLVKVLVNGSKDAGKHVVSFNAGSLAKGIYYYRISAGEFSDIKKLVIW